jgi:dTDP-4-dehydrorhamnose 3,5-epimerase
VPPFFAHGFQATGPGTDANDFTYRLTATWGPSEERAINPLDPDLSIEWPIADLVISEKDKNAPLLSQVKDELHDWFRKPE